MARRKSMIKVPIFKFKINKNTIFNIVGIFMVTVAVISLLATFNLFSEDQGRTLFLANQYFGDYFGSLKFFFPLLLILYAAHFFSTKKFKLIKPNITIGATFIFFSLLGIFQSGQFGQLIFNNLSLDFSTIGAVLILGTVFVIGCVLFLDTSLDAFFIFVFNIIKNALIFIKEYLFRQTSNKVLMEKNSKKKEKEKEFIEDKKLMEKKQTSNLPLLEKSVEKKLSEEIVIKPITKPTSSTWVYPPLTLLSEVEQKEADCGDVNENAAKIEKTLDSFGIKAKVKEFNKGPTVTQYALGITMGTKLSKITALANDLALALAAPTGQVRIEAPIPGRALVGIEIPNLRPKIVALKEMLSSPIFINSTDPLLVPLGLDVSGEPVATSVGKMPHALIAGATGSGKSVLLNSWITTFLVRSRPEELRLILVDPKRVELTLYNDIPHLLTPVIVDSEKIISALKWTVKEMEVRYKEFSKYKVRNIEGYNALEGIEKKPYIIFIIDELADLMMFAPGEAEELITRVAQMSRATGIHLILATQRPSVDVITGLMKANIPCRITFNVSSMIDSRVIIDMPGAEKLLGRGDMLYLPPDRAKPIRIQGPYVSEKDVNQIVRFLKMQSPEVHYTEEVTTQEVVIGGRGGTVLSDDSEKDPLFDKSLEIVMQHDKASASLLQRRLSIGYARAARILDQLEQAGYVGPAEGSKPREVIKRSVNPVEVEE